MVRSRGAPAPWEAGRPGWALGLDWIVSAGSSRGLSDGVGRRAHTERVTSAPHFNQWRDLRHAALALIADGLTGNAKAFLKAVRETKAPAMVLLFALPRSLCPGRVGRRTRPRTTPGKAATSVAGWGLRQQSRCCGRGWLAKIRRREPAGLTALRLRSPKRLFSRQHGFRPARAMIRNAWSSGPQQLF
jgi:hypothetical protein